LVVLMQNGLVLALIAAVSWAIGAVLVRKGVSQAEESFTAVAISVFLGIPLFSASVSLSGDWSKLWSLSGQGFILLGMAGIIHYVAGRLLSYNAYRLIGVNKASAFLRTSPFYTVILGVIFLKESLTIIAILGVVCIVAGAMLVSLEKESVSGVRQKGLPKTETKGIIAALGGALCWGISPVLIKPAVEEVGSPFVGALVAYAAASVITACLFFRRQHRQQMGQLRLASIIPLVAGGTFTAIGHLIFFAALGYSPASMVTPLRDTNVIFIILFSFLLNRNIEVFTPKVILGVLATAVGAFLIFF